MTGAGFYTKTTESMVFAIGLTNAQIVKLRKRLHETYHETWKLQFNFGINSTKVIWELQDETSNTEWRNFLMGYFACLMD